MPNSTPMGMDHRHLAIWMWTHSQSLTDNSETSIESAASDGVIFEHLKQFGLSIGVVLCVTSVRIKYVWRKQGSGLEFDLIQLMSSTPHLPSLLESVDRLEQQQLMLSTLLYVVFMMSYSGSILVQLGYYIIEEFCLEKFDRMSNLEEQLQPADFI
ncbi:unnamed protein product [Haemonchus placei]|uniref:Copper transporter n=1 Tax=Haemonchus placei TaxID=6290 RepID=A0A0N4WC41_HAEPC|nr:unnamed protein product [Haemonchus placei]